MAFSNRHIIGFDMGSVSGYELTPADRAKSHAVRGPKGALADPDTCRTVAECFVNGLTRAEMAEMFGVTEWTITQWRKDPRVKLAAQPLIEQRVERITRKIDSSIEARLANIEDIPLGDLLKIRKEYLGGALRLQTEGKIDDLTTGEAITELENNPDLASELEKLLNKEG